MELPDRISASTLSKASREVYLGKQIHIQGRMVAISRERCFEVKQGNHILQAVSRGRNSNQLVWGVNIYRTPSQKFSWIPLTRGGARVEVHNFSLVFPVFPRCPYAPRACHSEVAIAYRCFLHFNGSQVLPLRLSIPSFIPKFLSH